VSADVLEQVGTILRGDGDDARERALELVIEATAPESIAGQAIRLHRLLADYAYAHAGTGDRQKLSEIEVLALGLRVKLLDDPRMAR
jgi:hypothetical protein